ncbi:hypothetical protein [Salinimicrobium sp. HB62]|uniref:hypothetical protein n=1 Tax=Salinimicrobium sp. HB62 TaxID=3077781 RepID=UPI002D771A5C|nr:hypothetical protein [Salinimicrobium sp. HB62]
MKNSKLTGLLMILCMLFVAAFVSCDDEEEEIDLTENEMQKQEVFNQILNDEELFTEFMTRVRDNEQMLRNMYTREQVEAMMMADPEVIDVVLTDIHSIMIEDTTLLRNPERRERMMQNMTTMMERDTAMYREMQQRMQQRQVENEE